MNCPKCSNNHKYSSGMKCSCGYQFALDPKSDGIADRRFISFIKSASCNGTYWFTENQLYTAAARKQITVTAIAIISWAVIAAILVAAGIWGDPAFFLFLIVPGIGIISWLYYRFVAGLSRQKFEGWLLKYKSKVGPIPQLIESHSLKEPPAKTKETDVFSYGVERVLVVQRPILVDLLIRNKLHAANRAVVLTADRYPAYIAPHVEKLLQESPELPVFFLRDAGLTGRKWLADMKKESMFANGKRKLIDLGVESKTLKAVRKLYPLRLREKSYEAPLDVLPMAMLANGMALAMDQEIGLAELLVLGTSSDSTASFG